MKSSMETEIKPFGNNILVKPSEKKNPLLSERKMCEYGKVIAIGENVGRDWLGFKKKGSIKIGDTIGYTVWGLNSLEIKNEKHYFVPEDPRFILGTFSLPE